MTGPIIAAIVTAVIFIFGTVFWAGAMYQTVVNLRGDVSEIRKSLETFDTGLADLEVLHERVRGFDERIKLLETLARERKLA